MRERAIKSIPYTCKHYGQPFLSKYVSECISRLQKHGFEWEDKPYDILKEEYSGCDSSLKWWCNQYATINTLEEASRFDIAYNKYLKEFLIANPPRFNISKLCCKYAKKDVVKEIEKKYDVDLNIYGIRRAEGGIRAIAYKNCYSENDNKADAYRPLFFFSDEDKKIYEDAFGIIHSDCYEKYGFKRTGCACCPYGGKNTKHEMDALELYEPKLYKAVNNIFGDSYKYQEAYYEFRSKMKDREKNIKGQVHIDDILKRGE